MLYQLSQGKDLQAMRSHFPTFILVAIMAVCSPLISARSVPADPVYLGQKYCRACHSSSDDNRYHRWLNSSHARAFEALRGAEKTNPECLGCHTTGQGGPVSEKTERRDLRGVQCEACHGPGSDYKSMKVMKNRELARQNGLWDVTREICLKCHR